MNIKLLICGGMMLLALSRCSYEADDSMLFIENSELVVTNDSEEDSNDSSMEIINSQNTIEINDENYDTIVLNEDKVYISSFCCGYISSKDKMKSGNIYIAENDDQVNYIKEHWITSKLDEYYFEVDNYISPVSEFKKMTEKYPINKYVYFMEYDEVGSSGYFIHSNGLEIISNRIEFTLDETTKFPDDTEVTDDVMDGFFHMAAVPKELIQDMSFENIIYPS